MNTSNFLLFLLVVAAYSNLYLTFKRIRRKEVNKTKLPISSKEWNLYRSEFDSYKINNEDFKSWLKNRERLEK